MDRVYDVFERYPDGFPVWRAHASGLANAKLALQEIAAQTANECFIMYIPTKEVVARANVRPGSDPPGTDIPDRGPAD